MKIQPVVLAGFTLLFCVYLVSSQSCSRLTVGYTGQNVLRPPQPDPGLYIYINNVPAHGAMCNGTVYAWSYCFYPMESNLDVQMVFGAYQYDGNVSQYFLRPESYFHYNVTRKKNSFTCGNVQLPPEKHFQIYSGDKVGACIRASKAINILGRPTDQTIVAWRGTCDRNNMSSSPTAPFVVPSNFHLFASINIDECASGVDNCHATLATCSDVVGGRDSFECSCIDGYTGGGVQCTNSSDVDECDLAINACVENAVCADTEGSYTCMCSIGYSGDGFNRCTNIDECSMGLDDCVGNSTCADTEGSYACKIMCPDGYTVDESNNCTNVDECLAKVDLCAQNTACVDTNGSYTCMCTTGYTGDGFNSCIKNGSSSNEENMNESIIIVVVIVIACVILAMTALGVIMLLLCIKRRKRRLSDKCKFSVKMSGIHNAMVSKPTTTANSILDSDYHEQIMMHTTSELAAINQALGIQENATYEEISDIRFYCAPAGNEDSLYAQLKSYGIKEIPKNEIEIGAILGSGQFGRVNEAEWKYGNTMMKVAVKTLTDTSNLVMFLQEAAIMVQFTHPNVVTLYGVISKGPSKRMVLELLHNGNLKKYLKEYSSTTQKQFTPVQLLQFCLHICLGMHYLSGKGFVHRDLAARNVLVSLENICKIADFGMSRALQDSDYYVSQGGKIPVYWTAPEAVLMKKYSHSSDVWSFGCVLYEIWSLGHTPYEDKATIFAVVRALESSDRLPPPPGCPRMIYEAMIRCWHPEHSRRPQFSDVLSTLSQRDDLLLTIPDLDPPNGEAFTLGADLAAGHQIYLDLQRTYTMSYVYPTQSTAF